MRIVPFLLAMMLASVSSAGIRLGSYKELVRHLTSGGQARLVLNYAKCKLIVEGKEEKAPDAVGGMAVQTWEMFAKGVVRNDKAYIVTSETHLIAHARYGVVHNYVRVRIFEDGTVEITARYLKTSDMSAVMDETFTGRISTGSDSEGVSIFKSDGR